MIPLLDKGTIMKDIKLKNGQILTIAQATLEDAENHAIYTNNIMIESNFLSMDQKDGVSTANSQSKWIETTLNNDKIFIFFAKIDGKIVGCANFSPISNKIRFKHRCDMGISVLKEFWGLGIASEMMRVLVEKAKEVGYEQIELQVVDTNEPARHLYTKFGFYETGFINNAMKYTDGTYAKFILMQKDLI